MGELFKEQDNRELIGRINADIYTAIELSYTVGWDGIRPISIYRILYLASILYSFKHEDKKNPFLQDYNFSISLRGPYYEGIEKSLNYLLVNRFILLDEDTNLYKLGKRKIGDFSKMSAYIEKREWLTTVIYILGIYGEDKIYDFIFRDPEYQQNLLKNSQKPINLDKNNVTIEVLNRFKNAFESRLDKNSFQLDAVKYLKMYFEYVFSVILKGEAEL